VHDYAQICELAAQSHLAVLGAFHPTSDDVVPIGTQTLLLLGPLEPGFWASFTSQAEFNDGLPDPVDRWSHRTISTIAGSIGAQAAFPFGTQPSHPFYSWALRSGRAWRSPIQLLVHDNAGLFVSYRGALLLGDSIVLPHTPIATPCATCATQPCLAACPVNAVTTDYYDTAACQKYLETVAGQDCMTQGCAARRACPLAQTYGRVAGQSAFHMRYF
jgi:epoxyqueuosine reductase